MAKPFRKMSVSERVLQRRRTSVPPQPRDDAGADAVEALHVAPLAPPPIFDQGPLFIGTEEVPAPNAEAPKSEAPKSNAPKAEAPKAEAPKAEAAKAEAPKVEAPKAEAAKAEAPKVEAPKVEAPKSNAPKAEAPKGNAPKAAAPEVVAAPKVEAPKAKGEEVERSIAPVAAPETKTPADPLDVEPFPDSIPPVPERSGRAKLAMAGLAAFATVVGVGIGLRLTNVRAARLAAARAAVTAEVAAPTAEAPALPAYPVPPPPPPVETAAATAAPSASAVVAASASATAGAAAEPSASAIATAEPAPSASAVAAADEGASSAKELRDEALKLLQKSKNIEAMNKAAAAMEADPTDAMPYLVLGSALQENNRWREARRAYELCVKNARRGMVDECRAMLRRR